MFVWSLGAIETPLPEAAEHDGRAPRLTVGGGGGLHLYEYFPKAPKYPTTGYVIWALCVGNCSDGFGFQSFQLGAWTWTLRVLAAISPSKQVP